MQLRGAIPVWKAMDYRPPGADAAPGGQVPAVIVGAGPIGLAMALDLGRRGHPVVVLTALPFIAAGSKAICFSKRSLEILHRLGVGRRVHDKGVVWDKGKVFWRDDPVPLYEFDLLPVKDQQFPAFVNIQQYYVEEFLVDAIAAVPNIDIRWQHEVTSVTPHTDGATVTVTTPDGTYAVDAAYVLACDGAKSPVRAMLGLDFAGRVFEDNFLIADVKVDQHRPAERWFRFDPPYPGWSSLAHKQPDGVWRLDFQLGWDIDKAAAVLPENVTPFVRGMLGDDVAFSFEWISIYTFQCRRMARFVHDWVIFAGDAAHLVSPFGARGCNGGLQDVDNLGWKLDLVLRGAATGDLLETYNDEAVCVAEENILHSTRATDFMTPKSSAARMLRDAVLDLSRGHAFARSFINSGRLSVAVPYTRSPLNAPSDDFSGGPAPGDVCRDAPVQTSDGDGWLLAHLGDRFVAMVFTEDDALCARLRDALPGTAVLQVSRAGAAVTGQRVLDPGGAAHARYAVPPSGAAYLVRPDQHVAGRWLTPVPPTIAAAIRRASGGERMQS